MRVTGMPVMLALAPFVALYISPFIGRFGVSPAPVLGWNPEVIVCRDPSVSRAIKADPQWQTIAAVKNDRVVVNPWGLASWSVRTAEEALQVLWAPTVFHPEQFKDIDIRQVTRSFYGDFHQFQMSDADRPGCRITADHTLSLVG